jgi:hypothetical protein
VYFWSIVRYIKDKNIFMFLRIDYISLGKLSLMSICFLLSIFLTHIHCHLPQSRILLSVDHLRMLHMPHRSLLAIVQKLDVTLDWKSWFQHLFTLIMLISSNLCMAPPWASSPFMALPRASHRLSWPVALLGSRARPNLAPWLH